MLEWLITFSPAASRSEVAVKTSLLAMTVSAVLAAPVLAQAPPPHLARPSASAKAAGSGWRTTRWGMSEDEVLAALPGEAARLEKKIELADGNVVSLGIDEHRLLSYAFQVRFVFGAGKLALVSLRSLQSTNAPAEVFAAIEKHLTETLGAPAASDSDQEFIDLRQTRWRLGGTDVDLKYIPGVVVLQYHPRVPQP